MNDRLTQALCAIDAANASDPNNKELTYSQRMTEGLFRLEKSPSEILQLAARAQHIRRWDIPRNTYPAGRIGYLQWRTALYAHHAQITGEILQTAGYDPSTIQHVQHLLRKQGIKTDPEMQSLEDVICLVFLQYELTPFAQQQPAEKVIEILRKTWKKMSARGHAAALAQVLSLPVEIQSLVQAALSQP
ncbi:MAG TPA: DUF4202 domain-containing protein [Tepidisphaeraceae bacterium]|jgi:hypothetical protein